MTGASRGIGRATAVALAQQGASSSSTTEAHLDLAEVVAGSSGPADRPARYAADVRDSAAVNRACPADLSRIMDGSTFWSITPASCATLRWSPEWTTSSGMKC